jgi:hypothetical protein
VTSVGIFEYKNSDGSIRRELRLPEHVFDEESLASYEGKPVIITHDAGRVDKDNVDDEIVGTILSKGYRDGDNVRAKTVIHNIDSVKRSGLRELSLGYDLAPDETPGEWKGQKYDAIQTDIRINHLALVPNARAGDSARLNLDGNNQTLKGERSMTRKTGKAMNSADLKAAIAAYKARRQRRLDEGGPEEENTDSALPEDNLDNGEEPAPQAPTSEEKVQLIRDRRDRRDQEGDPDTPEAAMGVIAQQDEDIGALIDIIEELQAKSDFSGSSPVADNEGLEQEDEDEGEVTGPGGEGAKLVINLDGKGKATVDAIVRERLRLGRIGDKLNLDGLEDMDPLAAKKAVIKKVNPNMRLDGKGAAYINAAFDIAVGQINASTAKDTNYQRRQASGRFDSSTDFVPTGKTSAQSARERMIDKMQNGGDE